MAHDAWSPGIAELVNEGAYAVLAAATELERQGKKIVHFEIGQPGDDEREYSLVPSNANSCRDVDLPCWPYEYHCTGVGHGAIA